MAQKNHEVQQYRRRLEQTVAVLKKKFGPAPDVAVVFGSGLGIKFLKNLPPKKSVEFFKIPHFGRANVAGHQGTLHFIAKDKKTIHSAIIFQGRRHFYEGISLEELVFPYRALAWWGVSRLILTNASGGLRENLQSGDLVRITDHLNFMGVNPLRGPNLDFLGPRFPSLANLYRNPLSDQIKKIAKALKISLYDGVYVGIVGPSYETRAEIQAYRRLGGDLIGMSTVPEAIAAAHAGVEVAGLSVVGNSCLHSHGPLGHEQVLRGAEQGDQKLGLLLLKLLQTKFK